MIGQREIAEAEREMAVVGQAAGLCAGAAVAAAASDERGKQALAGVRNAECPVQENFGLAGGVRCDIANVFEGELPCQHDADRAELCKGAQAVQGVDGGLCADMDGQRGQIATEHTDPAKIRGNDAVGPHPIEIGGGSEKGLTFAVKEQGVHGGIDADAEGMAVGDGAFGLFAAEILCIGARAELRGAEVDGIRTGLHGGQHGVIGSGGREQFGERGQGIHADSLSSPIQGNRHNR